MCYFKLFDVSEIFNSNYGCVIGSSNRGVVVNGDLAVEHISYKSFVVVGSESISKLSGHRDLNIVVFGILRDKTESLNNAALEFAVKNLLERSLNSRSKTLHSRSYGHAFAILAIDDTLLVNVNADDFAVNFCGSFGSRGIDGTAAGEYDFGACTIPSVHSSGDIGRRTGCRMHT